MLAEGDGELGIWERGGEGVGRTVVVRWEILWRGGFGLGAAGLGGEDERTWIRASFSGSFAACVGSGIAHGKLKGLEL